MPNHKSKPEVVTTADDVTTNPATAATPSKSQARAVLYYEEPCDNDASRVVCEAVLDGVTYRYIDFTAFKKAVKAQFGDNVEFVKQESKEQAADNSAK